MADYFPVALIKKEVTEGLDPVPTPLLNAILTRGFKCEPLKIDLLERNLDLPALGATTGVPTNEVGMMSFECELQGSGAAGTAPPWMVLNEGCRMAAPVLTATVKAEQRMAAITAAPSSLGAYYYLDDFQMKLFGMRGDITAIDFTAGAYPFIGYDFMGIVPPAASTPFADVAPAPLTLTAWKDPLEVNTSNTSVSLDGFACVMRSFKAKVNADVKLRNLVGKRYIQRGNHKMDGSFLIELPTIAAKNYFSSMRNGTRLVSTITHGTVAGSIVQADIPGFQIRKIDLTEEDDIVMAAIDGVLTISAGQDDILLTAR
jgi:hypothetical protein